MTLPSVALNSKPCEEWQDGSKRPARPNGLTASSTWPAGESERSGDAVDWNDAWDWAAAESYLQRIDQRDHLHRLSEERVKLDQASPRRSSG